MYQRAYHGDSEQDYVWQRASATVIATIPFTFYHVDQAPYPAARVTMIAGNALFFHRLPNIFSHHEATYCRSVL